MNEYQLRQIKRREAANSFHRDMVESQLVTSCLNCSNFLTKPSEKCMKYNTLPPAEVIVFGCGAGWEADIPF